MAYIKPMKSIICVYMLFVSTCFGSTSQRDAEDGFYDSQTPENWVDSLFVLFMVIHHVYYAYKFTDYSLSHIHSELQEDEEKEEKKKQKKQRKKRRKQLRKYKPNDIGKGISKPKAVSVQKSGKKVKKKLKKAALSKNFTTQSTSKTKKRSMSNTVCCCLRCSPKYFTWGRTAYLRLFLRLFTSISCLLSMVLYCEFFMNLFVEYFITCIVHWDNGFIAGLLIIPIIIYVVDTLIKIAWQSVYVSWKINCDTNGDLESVEVEGTHHFNLEGNRFLFSYKIEAGEVEDEYDSDFLSSSSSESSSSDSYYDNDDDDKSQQSPKSKKPKSGKDIELKIVEEEESALLAIEKATDSKKKKKKNNKRSNSDFKAVKESARQRLKLTNNDSNESAKSSASARREKGDELIKKERDLEKEKKEKEKREAEKQKLRKEREDERDARRKQRDEEKNKRKEARRKARESMGDYFVAVCWRGWFFFGCVIAAVIAASTVNVEIAVNGFFWQLIMRYMVIGGFIWSTVYLIFAWLLSFLSRMMSWSLLHPNISRSRFFVLVDAKDHEKLNKKWRNCKVCTMLTSLILFILCCAGGIAMASQSNNSAGFVFFIGIIWIAYYLTNLFMSCKPYGLIALWTDSIPPPGKNFFAHLQVSENLKNANQLTNSLRLSTNRETQIVRIGTNHEVEMTEEKKDSKKNTKQKPPKIKTNLSTVTKYRYKKHAMSSEDIDALSTLSGISSFAPGLTPTKSVEAFSEERVMALMRRYKKFRYVYKETNNSKYKGICKLCPHWIASGKLFWNNYKNYWLNVYRPFDEYDMETNLQSTNILYGFQWTKECIECRCFQKKTKKKKIGKCASYILNNTCSFCLVLIVAACIGALFLFAAQLEGFTNESETLVATSSSSSNQTQYYPICSDYFGTDKTSKSDISSHEGGDDLSVLDVLFLSQAVYEMDNFVLSEMLDTYFDGEYEIIHEEQEEFPYFFHIQHKDLALEYLSIRGTASTQEALQDISLFVEVGLFETLQWVVPFLNALPTSFITALIYYASLTERLINADVRDQFDEPVYDYLTDYLSNTTTTLHILGHSLGGGISSIVAANLYEDNYDSNIASFGVCSPGALYSSAKFGFGIEALDKTSRALLPRRDLVSKVDVHGGAVQYTQCNEDSMLNCHVMGSIICEVFNNCPAKLARKPEFFDCFCNHYEDYPGQQFGYCMNNVTEIQ